jgi:hypothetical protein
MSGVVILIEITHSKRSDIIFWIVVLSAAIILALKIYFLWYWEPIPLNNGSIFVNATKMDEALVY